MHHGMHCVMHCAMHHAMHHVMHDVMHHVMHYGMHHGMQVLSAQSVDLKLGAGASALGWRMTEVRRTVHYLVHYSTWCIP